MILGNFQARAVTSAMEKTRLSLQTVGRMLFAQCTELINPATNRGLPPNLVGGEPSQSFIWKGTDIMIAALQAELGFLANPVGSHVQTAEMGNQAINSLALISGRYTLEAVQTLSQLSAAHLVATCQALDIRAMNIRFMDALAPVFNNLVEEAFLPFLKPTMTIQALQSLLWAAFQKSLDTVTHFDSPKRFTSAVESLQSLVLKHLVTSTDAMSAINFWTQMCPSRALKIFQIDRDYYFAHPDATPYIGIASRRMYQYLRNDLGVPFVGNETISTPSDETPGFDWGQKGGRQDSHKGTTMGTMITKVFESMRTGELYHVVMDCVSDVSTDPSIAVKKTVEINETQSTILSSSRAVPNSGTASPQSSESDSIKDSEKLRTPASTNSLASMSSKATTVIDPSEGYEDASVEKGKPLKEIANRPSSPGDPPVKFKALDIDGDVVRTQEVA